MLESRFADSQEATYRPDIDGMRAIAVLSVIAYHLAGTALPSGYLGVDIFFVLSGYLITSIIWREIGSRQFSIVNFYNRRIRRILPALLLVLLVTTALAVVMLLPVDLVSFARSVFATLAFVANIYFWRDTNYFSRVAEQKPLLHIWSLGVEEQFYVLFPLLLVLLARRMPRWTVAVVAALVGASLAGTFVAVSFGGALPAFYLLPTRAWELGTGALIALAPLGPERRQVVASVVGGAGLALVAAALASPRGSPYSEIAHSLAAVGGTALIVWAGRAGQGAIRRVLSWSALVFVGVISYSLYLWHWPIIVFSKYYLVRELTAREVVAALAIMFASATLSWRYLEQPFRSPATPIRVVYSAVLTAMLLAVAVAGVIVWRQGLPNRLNPAAARMNSAVGTHYRCPIADYLYFAQSRACELLLPSRDPADADIVLFGNSHAQMYAPLIADIVASVSRRGLLVPMNACTPTAGFNVSEECRQLAKRNLEAILALPRARVVVLATSWGGAAGPGEPPRPEPLIAALDTTIERLASAGKRVILVGPLASPGWDVASVASRLLAFGRPLDRPLFQPRTEFERQYDVVFARFEGRADVKFLRPDRVQCSADRCDYVKDGRSLFADGAHIAGPELSRFRPVFEAPLREALQD